MFLYGGNSQISFLKKENPDRSPKTSLPRSHISISSQTVPHNLVFPVLWSSLATLQCDSVTGGGAGMNLEQ